MKRWWCIAFAAVMFYACGSGLDGTYADSNGVLSYTFNSKGKVLISTSAFGIKNEVEADYKVEDGKIKIRSSKEDAAVVMTLLKDGSIEGPLGILIKQKK